MSGNNITSIESYLEEIDKNNYIIQPIDEDVLSKQKKEIGNIKGNKYINRYIDYIVDQEKELPKNVENTNKLYAFDIQLSNNTILEINNIISKIDKLLWRFQKNNTRFYLEFIKNRCNSALQNKE